jgi:ketosteroid isomerase-like protein
MRMTRIFMLMLLAASVTFGQGGSKTSGDETKIIALENLWNQMQINHDAEAMGQMLDANFVLTDYDGTIMSKGEFLASVRDMSNVLTTEVSQDMRLFSHGDTVIVIGATREAGAFKGKPFEHHGRFTDTWMRSERRWVCLASQLSLTRK